MSLDDQVGTPPTTDGNGTADPADMDAQYAAFQADVADDDTTAPEAEQAQELGADPQFETVQQFVTGWVMPFYVRDTANAVWCRQWWAHPEAALRLEALWEAYEGPRVEGRRRVRRVVANRSRPPPAAAVLPRRRPVPGVRRPRRHPHPANPAAGGPRPAGHLRRRRPRPRRARPYQDDRHDQQRTHR